MPRIRPPKPEDHTPPTIEAPPTIEPKPKQTIPAPPPADALHGPGPNQWTWSKIRRIKWAHVYADLRHRLIGGINRRCNDRRPEGGLRYTRAQCRALERWARIFTYDKATRTVYLRTCVPPPDMAYAKEGGNAFPERVYVVADPAQKDAVIQRCFFDPCLGGYRGTAAVWRKLSTGFVNISRTDVHNVLSKVEVAQLRAPQRVQEPIPIPSTSRERLQVDLMDMRRFVKNNFKYKWLMVCIDHWSKYIWVVALKNKLAKTINSALLDHVLLRHGRFDIVHTDNGKEFNHLEKLVEGGWFQKVVRGEPYQSTSQGAVERANRTVREAILKYIAEHQCLLHYEYVQALPYLVWCYNNTRTKTTRVTPTNAFFNIDQPIDLQRLLGRNRVPSAIVRVDRPRAGVHLTEFDEYLLAVDLHTAFAMLVWIPMKGSKQGVFGYLDKRPQRSKKTSNVPRTRQKLVADAVRDDLCVVYGRVHTLYYRKDNKLLTYLTELRAGEATSGEKYIPSGGWIRDVCDERKLSDAARARTATITKKLIELRDRLERNDEARSDWARVVYAYNEENDLFTKFYRTSVRGGLLEHVGKKQKAAQRRMVDDYRRQLNRSLKRDCHMKVGSHVRVAMRLYKEYRKLFKGLEGTSLKHVGAISSWSRAVYRVTRIRRPTVARVVNQYGREWTVYGYEHDMLKTDRRVELSDREARLQIRKDTVFLRLDPKRRARYMLERVREAPEGQSPVYEQTPPNPVRHGLGVDCRDLLKIPQEIILAGDNTQPHERLVPKDPQGKKKKKS